MRNPFVRKEGSPQQFSSSLNNIANEGLPYLAAGSSLIFLFFSGFNIVFLPEHIVRPIVSVNLLLVLLFALASVAAYRRIIPKSMSSPMIVVIHMLALLNAIQGFALTGDTLRTVYAALVIVCIGCFLLSWRWHIFSVFLFALLWVLTGTTTDLSSVELTIVTAFLAGSGMLSIVVHYARMRSIYRLLEAEKKLTESEELYRDIIDNALDLIHSVDANGYIRFVNRAWEKSTGYKKEEVIGRHVYDFIDDKNQEHCKSASKQLMSGNTLREAFFPLRSKQGITIYLSGNISPRLKNGRFIGSRGFFRDVTNDMEKEKTIRSQEALLHQLATHIKETFWVYDLEKNAFVFVSDGFLQLSGFSSQFLMNDSSSFFRLFYSEDIENIKSIISANIKGRYINVDHRLKHKSGAEKWVHLESSPVFNVDGTVSRIVGFSEDITDRKKRELELEYYATVDGLTGVENRRQFDKKLKAEIKRHQRSHLPLSLLLIDIDHFKRFNDEFGHLVGDECLCAVASKLKEVADRESDTVARYGGEEFAILLTETNTDGATIVAGHIHEALNKMDIGENRAHPTVSVGISSIIPERSLSPEKIIHQADKALYDAKSGGRNRTEIYH